ncbi:hypothetical protein [Cellulomonas fimi]|uniref:hypothetical protein n=1 Tax=Cellulomonas fimi TaxID=1708 RepID=UPI0023588EE9|nr:hypothetical protein [Cellulomonas fimi]
MDTTRNPDDDGPGAGTGPGDTAAADEVLSAAPAPPPPVGVGGVPASGAGGAHAPTGGATAASWTPPAGGGPSSVAVPPQPTDRRSLLVGVAAGVGGVVVLGALVYALWPDGGSDAGSGASMVTSTAPAETPTPTPTPEEPTVTVVDRAVPATQVWTPMGVTCVTGDVFGIEMSGSVSHDQSAGGTVGPNGLLDPFFHQFNVEGFPDANTVTVIGSLDEDPDTFFVVGERAAYVCPRDGQLYLGVNDAGVANNSGAFLATITLTHD